MGAEDSIKKLKRKKNTNKKREDSDIGIPLLAQKDETIEISGGKKKSKKLSGKKTKKREIGRRETEILDTYYVNEVEDGISGGEHAQSELAENKLKKSRTKRRKNIVIINRIDECNEKHDAPGQRNAEAMLEISGERKKSKKLRDKQRKKGNLTGKEAKEIDTHHMNEVEDRSSGREFAQSKLSEDKLQKSRKKKRKNAEIISDADTFNENDNVSEPENDSKPEDHFANSGVLHEGDTGRNSKTGNSEKLKKRKKKNLLVVNDLSSEKLLEKKEGDAEDEVYQMSSGDEDYSKGLKKWITQYHQSRPGLKVLQERIDDFIMTHETKEEQARAEREAHAAEGGWTVVIHHKGRKKTTDTESGIAVGSVAQAAVLDKMGKKKKKEVGLDFYRFQKREARRNEIMMLQSKFEQDKKRIQQMRAARKFRPY